ncbi:MAG TPA: ribosome-associated translation inhibitor RaiA [Chloroflexia bacterium]|nr:ribosome-associated translation inhibitor RaiA [Chloroflexia bacterium]
MDVTIRPKNFKLAGDIEQQIRKRIDRLSRHIDNITSTEVVLSQQTTHLNAQRFEYRAQFTLHTRNNNLIRSEVSNPELLTAIDQAMDHLSRQVERYRTRHDRRKKGSPGLRKSTPAPDANFPGILDLVETDPTSLSPATTSADGSTSGDAYDEDDEDNERGVVRVKRFNVKPMFPEDAIEEMELLGHSFFVFMNATDEQVNVLYRRNDGNYGLIQPDLS